MTQFDTIVIGNGLMGSAAARYLSEWQNSVAIVGPAEPADHSTHTGVFSSHYDQGRLTRKFSQDPVWAVVGSRAVDNYAMLEEKSGITFYGPVGRVHARREDPAEEATYQSRLQRWMADVDPAGAFMHYFSGADRSWQERFPYLQLPDGYSLFYEGAPAGYVNPRDMLRAQNTIAQQHGAALIEELVVEVQASGDGVVVTTVGGRQLTAQKALIACGAFTNFNNLLPEPLPLRLKTETMIWANVSHQEAERLKAMPGVGYDIDDPDIDDIYIAPPILYPDGNYKIKMGCNSKGELWPNTLEEAQAWFQSGNSDVDLPPMENALRSLFPGVDFGPIASHRCIVAYTPSGYPTIDQLPSDPHGRLYVATGGNGTGAGGSDTLGCLAAGLLHDGRWIDELDRELFLATNRWGNSRQSLSKAQARALATDS